MKVRLTIVLLLVVNSICLFCDEITPTVFYSIGEKDILKFDDSYSLLIYDDNAIRIRLIYHGPRFFIACSKKNETTAIENEIEYYQFILRYELKNFDGGSPYKVENSKYCLFKDYGYNEKTGEWYYPDFIDFLTTIEKEYPFHYCAYIGTSVPSRYDDTIYEIYRDEYYYESEEIHPDKYKKGKNIFFNEDNLDFYYDHKSQKIIFNIENTEKLNSFEIVVPVNNRMNEYRLFIFNNEDDINIIKRMFVLAREEGIK